MNTRLERLDRKSPVLAYAFRFWRFVSFRLRGVDLNGVSLLFGGKSRG
jgi:hypothetical protein